MSEIQFLPEPLLWTYRHDSHTWIQCNVFLQRITLSLSLHYLHYARVSFLSKGGLYSVRVWTLSTVRMNCVNVDTGGVTLLCLSLRGHNRRSWTRLTSTSSPQKTRRMPNLWINLSSELVFLLWFLNTNANPNPLSRHNRERCVTFCKNVNAQDGIREWREGS